MKKGWIFTETLLALAIFALISCPMLYILQENFKAEKFSAEVRNTSFMMSNILEELYSGGLPDIEANLIDFQSGFLVITFREKQYTFSFHPYACDGSRLVRVSIKLVETDGRNVDYESTLEVLFQTK
jgi:hypothetical protein